MVDIKHAHLYGSRSDKYEWLLSHDVLSTDWQSLQPQTPFYLFIIQICWESMSRDGRLQILCRLILLEYLAQIVNTV